MAYEMSMLPKQGLGLKQMQRLIMSPQMQQALHLLQLPILELSALVEMELEQNPVLESSQEEMDDEESERIKEENEELSENENADPEKSLSFDDRDFEILRRLDEEFSDHFNESGGELSTKNN